MTILLMVGTLFHPGGVTPPGGDAVPHNLPFFVTLGKLKSF
jgi:hypothetical protein